MDFSNISSEDLQAIQAKQWDKVSTPGLQEFQKQRQQQSAPPTNVADKQEIQQGGQQSGLEKFFRTAVAAPSAFRGGIMSGITFGALSPDKIPGAMGKAQTTAAQEDPTIYSSGKLIGAGETGAAVGGALAESGAIPAAAGAAKAVAPKVTNFLGLEYLLDKLRGK